MAHEGISVEVEDGFAHIQFLDRAKAGPAIARLLELGGPELIDVDTRSNPRKTYIVPEGMAVDAGLLDVESESEDQRSGTPDDSWTVAQLREYASRKSISLGEATRKADILAVINGESPSLAPEPPTIAAPVREPVDD